MLHTKCGGNVLIKLKGIQIVSPYIGISLTKLMVNKIDLLTPTFKTPCGNEDCEKTFICSKCLKELTDLENEIIAVCNICGNEFLASKIFVTNFFPFTCEGCRKKLREDENLRKIFDNLPTRIESKPLLDVLRLGIKV